MKTRKGYTLRSLGNEYILVPEGLEAVDCNRMISMNATAAYLWESVEGKEFDAEALVLLLLDEYDISREVAEHDVADLVQNWLEAGIIN
jgi:hypothetical protein